MQDYEEITDICIEQQIEAAINALRRIAVEGGAALTIAADGSLGLFPIGAKPLDGPPSGQGEEGDASPTALMATASSSRTVILDWFCDPVKRKVVVKVDMGGGPKWMLTKRACTP